MRLRRLMWLRLLGTSLLVLALLLPGTILAQETVTVRLDPVGESGVSGTATLTAAGDETHVALDISGLVPGTDARATMNANTCAMPSASFAALPDLKADASGRAVATGSVLFHRMDAALTTMADSEHIIAIKQIEQVVACGVITKPTSASAPPALPASGGAAFPFVAALEGVLLLCAVLAGLCLWHRSRLGDGF